MSGIRLRVREMVRKKVVIVQRVLPHYRVPFFEALNDALARHGIDLVLIHGQERPGTVPRSVEICHPWVIRIRNGYWGFGGARAVWQPCLKEALSADLVIVEQANSLLLNHLLLLLRRVRGMRVAYWGHGRNFQAKTLTHSFSERIKRSLIRSVDWWFAYTDLTRSLLLSEGFDTSRITVVQNAIDTRSFEASLAEVSPERLSNLRNGLGIAPSDPIGLFCGGLYADKGIDWLIEACLEIRARRPDFHMLFLGDGPEEGRVERAARTHPWIHHLGPMFGGDRAPYFRMSHLMLMPRLVGLAVVDSFVAQVPLVTTDSPGHGPEFAYLEDGVNGLVTQDTIRDYVDGAVSLLEHAEKLEEIRENCRASALKFTLDEFVLRFSNGVVDCLGAFKA